MQAISSYPNSCPPYDWIEFCAPRCWPLEVPFLVPVKYKPVALFDVFYRIPASLSGTSGDGIPPENEHVFLREILIPYILE